MVEAEMERYAVSQCGRPFVDNEGNAGAGAPHPCAAPPFWNAMS